MRIPKIIFLCLLIMLLLDSGEILYGSSNTTGCGKITKVWERGVSLGPEEVANPNLLTVWRGENQLNVMLGMELLEGDLIIGTNDIKFEINWYNQDREILFTFPYDDRYIVRLDIEECSEEQNVVRLIGEVVSFIKSETQFKRKINKVVAGWTGTIVNLKVTQPGEEMILKVFEGEASLSNEFGSVLVKEFEQSIASEDRKPSESQRIAKEDLEKVKVLFDRIVELDPSNLDAPGMIPKIESEIIKIRSQTENIIPISIAGSFTGEQAYIGNAVRAIVNWRLWEINEAGGINGRKVIPIFVNDASNPRVGIEVVRQLGKSYNIPLLIGPYRRDIMRATSPLYDKLLFPEISPLTTIPTLPGDWNFSIIPYENNLELQAQTLAKYTKDNIKSKKVLILYNETNYSVTLRNAFTKEAEKIGLEFIGSVYYSTSLTDFTSQVADIMEKNPDSIFIAASYSDAYPLIWEIRQEGMVANILGTSVLLPPEDVTETHPLTAFDDLYITFPFIYGPKEKMPINFIDKYQQKYQRLPGPLAINTYNCIELALQAFREAGADRQGIQSYFSSKQNKVGSLLGTTEISKFLEHGYEYDEGYVPVFQVKEGKFRPAD